MKKITCFFRLILPIIVFQLGFNASVSACQHANAKTHKKLLKTTIADVREDHYDLKYTKLTIALNNNNTNIAGSVVYYAVVSNPLMNEYVFELLSTIQIDSIFVNNQLCTYTRNANVVTVPLSSAMTAGTFFTTKIVYHGTPTSGTGFFSAGINTIASPSWGNKVTYTLSASYHGFEWFPCKQSLKDKIDSSSVWITVPDSLKAGSNGLLNKVTSLPNNLKRFEWSTKYPIDYYLISVSVANYVDYSYYMHFDNSTDSMLIQNYVYNNPATLPTFKSVIDSTELMINQLSNLFGRYPFYEEKYGHCMAPLSGGMEHQTMTTLGFFNGTLVVHELGHQWFGDYVTCANWGDIWLNEGFASYSEQLMLENLYPGQEVQNMAGVHTNVMSQAGGSVWVLDSLNESRIFSGRLTYDKGAAIIHSMRYIMNNDSLFFETLQNFLTSKAYATAYGIDVRDAFTQASGIDYTPFFDEWYFGEGFPTYSIEWRQLGSDALVKISHTSSMPNVTPTFTNPIDLKFTRPGNSDTTIRFDITSNANTFQISGIGTINNSIVIDPSNWIVNQNGTIVMNELLDITSMNSEKGITLYPNPSTDEIRIEQLVRPATYVIYDMFGKIQQKGTAANNQPISLKSLLAGSYLMLIETDGKQLKKSFIKR
jgi:aminopeptidase N